MINQKHKNKLRKKKQQPMVMHFITQLRRRLILATNMVFSQSFKYPRYFHSSLPYNIIPYWYKRKGMVSVNQKFHKPDIQLLKSEKEIQKRRNSLLYTGLQLQRYLPYTFLNTFFYLSQGVGGSTALRRYQFNLTQIQPAR